MEKVKFKACQEDKGVRLDQYLVNVFKKKYSRSYIQRLISDDMVLINNHPAKAHLRLKGLEDIEVLLPPEKKKVPQPEKFDLNIVYEDNYILIVNKPANMVVHPASGNFKNTLVNALLYHTKNLSKLAGPLRAGIVHRLDKDTSGLLVIAKDDETHQLLAKQFKERSVKRKYIALVQDVMQLDRGIIDVPIGRSQTDRKKMDVDYLSKKDALTYYEVLEKFKNATLLELNLKTGRTHQARIHLKYIGHPIIGDKQYGVRKDAPRQMLHAKTLGFIHPKKEKYVEFNSPMPEDMKRFINRLSR